ncbi:MAG: phosphopentomutase [Spirochaetales bacterium]|nr:phosphopentomutase [Spirochaetales bacterium]
MSDKAKRATVLVIDSFGIGELPDAGDFGDKGANTALHICEHVPGPKWPVLRKMGLGNSSVLLGNTLPGCEPVEKPVASWGVMKEVSPGKDTTTGHWELAGLQLEKSFTVFPSAFPSFPEKLVADFIQKAGCKGVLGNKAASGTEIIAELGEEHLKTGFPIIYTSGDSVFQIAAHNDIYKIDKLYEMCEIARKLCDEYYVGRVIARPFDGKPGEFFRTKDRHDYSIALPGDTILDHLRKNGVETVAVGKIGSIFDEQGIDVSYHDAGNPACLARTEEIFATRPEKDQFLFVNLVDTDMVYGHRRDPLGYCNAVSAIDDRLDGLMRRMDEEDLLIITADHGCDPAYKGTDHTREHIPLLVYGKNRDAVNLGIRETFADAAQSLAAFFGTPAIENGTDMLG